MTAYESVEGPRFELELGTAGYPEMLTQIPNPPKRIYGIGNPDALIPGVGIIGARKATPYGLSCTELMADHVANRGLTIISGGARGCDQAAHAAAVNAGTPTVVVFGSGADVVYPKTGKKLFQRVVDNGGAIISENPWGTPPLRNTFPQRNRIIAGLSRLLIIAEAGLPSGTFSTADAALEQGKVVAAVPGSILSPNSKGSNSLLCDGALAVIDHETLDAALDCAFECDILAMMPPVGGADVVSTVMEMVDKDPLLRVLVTDAYSPGELTAYFGFSRAEIVSRLSNLEMQGIAERGRDGRYQVCAHVKSKYEAERAYA